MSEAKVQKLRVKRQTIIGQQDRVKQFVEKQASVASVQELEIRLSALEKYYSDFQVIQSSIEELDATEGESDTRALFEEQYFLLQPAISTWINICTQKNREATAKDSTLLNTTIGGSTVKLPKVPLPTFAGDYTKWLSYYETFSALVDHNDSLDDITKFHYLRASLSGEPLRRIQSIEITTKNYSEVLKMLKDRYAKTTVIVEEHIKQILNFPPITKVSVENIRELVDSVNAHLRSLTSLGRPVAQWDDLIITIILSKLDHTTNDKWIDDRVVDRLPTLKELFTFLDKRCHQLERKVSQQPHPSTSSHIQHPRTQKMGPITTPKTSFVVAPARKLCHHCLGTNHVIYRCRKFLTLTAKERFLAANTANLCINCLKPDHSHQKCISERCKTCKGSHHTLLHAYSGQTFTNPDRLPPSSGDTSSNAAPAAQSSLSALQQIPDTKQVLLATAIIQIFDKYGQPVICRALLDSGSQIHIMTEALAQQLGVKRTKTSTEIRGIGPSVATARYTVDARLRSVTTTFSTELCFHILPRISECHPDYHINISEWNLPNDIKLADPMFHEPKKIDVLLGAEIYFDLLVPDQIRLGDSFPILQNTVLGYIVTGGMLIAHSDQIRLGDSFPILQNTVLGYIVTGGMLIAPNHQSTYHCQLSSTPSIASLDMLLQKFWEIESHNAPSQSMTQEEKLCELHFAETVQKSSIGRFVIRLPFRKPATVLGNSLQVAQKRLLSLERKFKRDPELQEQYIQFMEEYEALHHMRRVFRLPQKNFFLPHHAVIKSTSSSTKLRVVFDASAKSTTNISLNDILMTGPTVQSDLFTVIVRFRTYRYVFTTDVKQMYRQIIVDPVDRPYQMIVWRKNPLSDMCYYELNTVTYGTSAAPYIATRCLKQLALDDEETYPSASVAILKETYVDDIMTGAHNLRDAIKLQNDLVHILKKAHFELRKFCANEPSLLSGIPTEHREPCLKIGENDVVKTLGLAWEPSIDAFVFHIAVCNHTKITKRIVLSDLGKIFDPLGLIGPVVVLGKIFLQDLWKHQFSWDEALPEAYQQKWSQYIQQLQL